jgi:hypothetical protein
MPQVHLGGTPFGTTLPEERKKAEKLRAILVPALAKIN